MTTDVRAEIVGSFFFVPVFAAEEASDRSVVVAPSQVSSVRRRQEPGNSACGEKNGSLETG